MSDQNSKSGPAKIGIVLPKRAVNDGVDHDAAERSAIEGEAYFPPVDLSTATTKKPTILVRNAVDLAARLPPFVWLSRSFGLIRGRVLAMSGFGDGAKSFATMDLMLAVASGDSMAMGGVKIDMEGPVLHIDYEQQWAPTAMRYQRLARGRGIDLAALGDRLQYASGLDGDPKTRVPFLHEPGAEAALIKLATGKAVVLIDNFAASCGGTIDMNKSSAAMVPYILGRVSAATGAAVCLIAHEAKPSPDRDSARTKGQKMMGSGQIHAALGGGLGFTKTESGTIKVEQSKETMAKAPEPVYFRLVDEGATDSNTGLSESIRLEWVPAEEQAESAERAKKAKAAPAKGIVRDVLAFVTKHGPCSGNQVRLGVDGTNQAKDGALRQLVDDGRILTSPGQRGAVIFRAV